MIIYIVVVAQKEKILEKEGNPQKGEDYDDNKKHGLQVHDNNQVSTMIDNFSKFTVNTENTNTFSDIFESKVSNKVKKKAIMKV